MAAYFNQVFTQGQTLKRNCRKNKIDQNRHTSNSLQNLCERSLSVSNRT